MGGGELAALVGDAATLWLAVAVIGSVGGGCQGVHWLGVLEYAMRSWSWCVVLVVCVCGEASAGCGGLRQSAMVR